MFKQLRYFTLIILFVVYSCEEGKEKEINNNSNSHKALKSDTLAHNAKVFMMPAPLQIPSLLKISNSKFSENVIIPSKKGRTFSSDYMRAINLGMYTVDVAYASVYDQKQSALNYYRTISELLKDLNLASNIVPKHLERFKNNIEKSDSLCIIISESFNLWQNYYQENNREDIALYIMAGSYIESLYLTVSVPELRKSEYFNSIIGQQKLFLDNILELSNYMEKRPEFDDLYDKLGALQELYLPFDIKEENLSNAENPKIRCTYSNQNLQNLTDKLKEIRKNYLK